MIDHHDPESMTFEEMMAQAEEYFDGLREQGANITFEEVKDEDK